MSDAILSQSENPFSAHEAKSEVIELAGRWQRLGGALLDGVISLAYVIPAAFAVGAFDSLKRGEQPPMLVGITMLALSIAGFVLVHGYLLKKNGQTVGKRIVGTRIVDLDDEKPGVGRILGRRYVPLWIAASVPLVGQFLALLDALFVFRSDRRCIHDLIAGTKVVRVSGQGIKGFTAVMVVGALFLVPIAGIIAAVAIPAYQDYQGRAKIALALHDLGGFRPQFADLVKAGDYTVSLPSVGITLPASHSFRSLYYDPKSLTLVGNLGEPFQGRSIGIRQKPSAGDGPGWMCGSTNLESRLLPKMCREKFDYLNEAESLAFQRAILARSTQPPAETKAPTVAEPQAVPAPPQTVASSGAPSKASQPHPVATAPAAATAVAKPAATAPAAAIASAKPASTAPAATTASAKPAAIVPAAATAAGSKSEKGAPIAAPATMIAAAAPPIAAPAEPAAPGSGTRKRSRANEDARKCLELPTNAAIIKCAEKFR